jgi:hypothetical protein
MSFPNGVIENFISSQNWFINLFASPLSIMRLISAESVPEPLGFLLTEYYTKVNLFKGPNSRHNVFGYVYIGYYGAFVFSFILGYLTSFVRNKLYIIFSATPIGMVFYIGILMGVFELEGDFYLGLSNIINIIPLFLIWCICCIVFSKHLNIIFPFKINSLCFKS